MLDRARARNFPDVELTTLRMPVDSAAIPALVDEALEAHRPDIWISLGLHPGSPVVAVERTAANVMDFPVPDNAAAQPVDAPVFADGPFAYRATLPVKAIVREMNDRAIPAKVSNTASTYLCNQIMYTALHLSRMKALATRAGFVHVPCSPGYVAKAPYPEHEFPSMSVDLMADAVDAAIAVSARREADIAAPPKGY